MLKEELKADAKVIHVKHNRMYRIVSANCRFKATSLNLGWIDAVCYAPLYENDYTMFMRELNSFLNEFEIVK